MPNLYNAINLGSSEAAYHQATFSHAIGCVRSLWHIVPIRRIRLMHSLNLAVNSYTNGIEVDYSKNPEDPISDLCEAYPIEADYFDGVC